MAFWARVTLTDGDTFVMEEVREMIAPAASTRFWTFFPVVPEEGQDSEAIFINESEVRSVKIKGPEEEPEVEQTDNVLRPNFQVVDDLFGPEGS